MTKLPETYLVLNGREVNLTQLLTAVIQARQEDRFDFTRVELNDLFTILDALNISARFGTLRYQTIQH
jgi:hypothetical protein